MLFSEELFDLIDEVEEFLKKDHKAQTDYVYGVNDFSDVLKDRVLSEDRMQKEDTDAHK